MSGFSLWCRIPHRIACHLIILGFFAFSLSWPGVSHAGDAFVPGEIIVKYKNPRAQTLRVGPTAEQAAIKCAEAWLALADAEKNAESYDQAAALFRRAVTKEQWLQSIDRLKKPLGKTVSRKLLSKKYTTTLPGAPDGQYVIIQYQTRFENKTAAVETITPMLERDGRWRVSGYFIK